VLSEGDYQLTFELRLMSDLLTGDGSQAFDLGATCRAAFNVGARPSVVMVRVTFGVDTCSVSLTFEPMGRRDLYPR
jgi:hypothetical protein